MTENLTVFFIRMFHSRIPGKMASTRSVTMETAEKKKLTALLSLGLQVPSVVAPHSMVMGWQMLATTRMKTTAVIAVKPMTAQRVHTKRRRASAMRSSVMLMLHFMNTVQAA